MLNCTNLCVRYQVAPMIHILFTCYSLLKMDYIKISELTFKHFRSIYTTLSYSNLFRFSVPLHFVYLHLDSRPLLCTLVLSLSPSNFHLPPPLLCLYLVSDTIKVVSQGLTNQEVKDLLVLTSPSHGEI